MTSFSLFKNPIEDATTVCVPAGTFSMVNFPSASEAEPSREFWIRIFANGTGSPLELTVPVKVVWAKAVVLNNPKTIVANEQEKNERDILAIFGKDILFY
tara:strand:- start:169 stop:468 length:300 start_codon:yes stop_codon:yes gene_type:complete